MSQGKNGLGCPLRMWIAAAVVGGVVTLFSVASGSAWLTGIFLGIVTCGLVGLLLTWLVCTPQAGPRRQVAFGNEDPQDHVARAMRVQEPSEPAPVEPAPVAQKPAPEAPQKAPESEPVPEPLPEQTPVEASEPETGPSMLAAARDGAADDLKKIKGVGPKLEGVLNELGVYHYDQIAAWSPQDVAWVDARLKFKGRIERDNWIAQAAALAKG